MSLDISLLSEICPACGRSDEDLFEWNITHNLGDMASEALLYLVLWRPEEIGVTIASEALPFLELGLADLLSDPYKFRDYIPENGWGSYEGLVECVEAYITACRDHPDAVIEVCR